MQGCGDVLCFDNVGAEAGDDRLSVAEQAVSVTEWEPGKARVKDGLGKEEDGELGGLHLRFAGIV